MTRRFSGWRSPRSGPWSPNRSSSSATPPSSPGSAPRRSPASAVGATVLGTVVGLCVFLAYGTTAAVARRLGAGDHVGAVRDGVAGLWLALAVGTVLMGVLAAAAVPLVEALGASPETSAYAATYLRVSALGLPAMLLVLAGTGVRRGLQDTRTPLAVAVVAAVVNLGLAIVLVLGAGLGVAGSAWATVIAQLGAATAYVVLVRRDAVRASAPAAARWRGGPARRARWGAAVPAHRSRCARSSSSRSPSRHDSATCRSRPTSSRSCTWILLALALDSLAIAGQAIVGRSLGAGDVAGTRAAVHRMKQWGVWSGVVLGLAVLVARPFYVSVFSLDPAVASAVSAALVVVAIHQPVAGPAFVLDGVLIGAGDARWLAGAQLVMLAAYVPVAVAVPLIWTGDAGLVALWFALLWFMVVRLLLLTYRARSDAWLITGATR